MTPEQINIAIAEACGWTEIGSYYKNWDGPDTIIWDGISPTEECQKGNIRSKILDYCGDLNAMHEAEKVLADPQTDTYLDMLAQVCGHQYKSWSERNEHLFWCWNATARQRAEAFLRALNKWEDPNA